VPCGPAPRWWLCWVCRVRRTSTRARNWGCLRSTFRWSPGWIRCGPAAASAATAPASPLPWTENRSLSHGFSLAEAAAEPWLPQPPDWGTHAVELQQQDPESSLALVTKALELRRLLWKNEVFGPNDGGAWRVEAGNLLICARSADFFVAVAMGTEPVQLPAGSVLLSAAPLAEDGWLQPNNAVWVLRD